MDTPSLESIYLLLEHHCLDSHDEHQEIKDHLKTLNGRVGRLEVWRGVLTGGLAIVTLVFSTLLVIFRG